MEYLEYLEKKFKDIKIEIVNFDNGATPQSMAVYILCSNLDKKLMTDKGNTVLDLSNYLHQKYGLWFLSCPEYHRKGEPKNSLAFYVSKELMDKQNHVKEWLIETYNRKVSKNQKTKRYESALYWGRRFLVYGEGKNE